MASEDLAKVDAVAFDCDGVLVDARRSYDKAIRVVVETMVKGLTGTRLALTADAPDLIADLRRTGGFNSDWDSAYALTLFAFVSLRAGEKTGTPLGRLKALTAKFGAAPRRAGVRDADAFLDEEYPSMADDLKSASDYLGYPGRPPNSKLATLFDELYFGASLYKRSHGFPGSGPTKGFIDLEKLLIRGETLRALEKKVGAGRLAIITGRPSLGTAHTLGRAIVGKFNPEASIFIGDADINPALKSEYDKFRKPSPEALVRARERLSSETLLYVGDSAEDLMMVKDGEAEGRLQGCLFAGVYGMSPEPKDQIRFFKSSGADLIVKSVNDIPSRLLGAGEKR